MGISDNSAFSSNMANIAAAQYGPTATTNQANVQANTALTGQQTQSASMQNQITQASMPMLMQAMSEASADMSSTNPGNVAAGQGKQAPGTANAANADQSGDQSGGVAAFNDTGKLADTLRNQNFVPPYIQSEMQTLSRFGKLSGIPGMVGDYAKQQIAVMEKQRQARIDSATANNQRNMGNMYDTATAVAKRDPNGLSPGTTFQAFAASDAPDAAIIKNEATDPVTGNFDPVQADTLARNHSKALGAVSHLYSGRPTHMDNGQLVDDKTGQPVTGQDQIFTGLTGEQRATYRNFALEKVDVPHKNGVTTQEPRFSAPKPYGFGGLTPDQYVAQQDRVARNLPDPTAAAPPATATPVSKSAPAATNAPGSSPSTALPTHRPAPTPRVNGPVAAPGSPEAAGQTAAPAGTPASTNGPVPPVGSPQYNQRMTVALKDPDFKAEYNPTTMDSSPGPAATGVKEKIDQYMSQRNDAQREFSEHSTAAAGALQNFNAAKAILSAPDGTPISGLGITGPIGGIVSRLSALGYNTDTATRRQEAAKYLVNGAVAGLKQTYGSRPGVFDVKINVEKAFPNLETQGIPATMDLIDSQIKQAAYLRDSAVRGNQYIRGGGEPTGFTTWQEKHFPRANLVTPGQNGNADAPGNATMPTVSSAADHAKLAPGTQYRDPNGVLRTKAGT
jgi:hypothetical protein